jgi:hypothetical protein
LDVGGLVLFPGYGTVDRLIAAVGITHKVVPMVGRLDCLYQINGELREAGALGRSHWWTILKALAWLPFTPLSNTNTNTADNGARGGDGVGAGGTLTLWEFYMNLGLPNILIRSLDARYVPKPEG